MTAISSNPFSGSSVTYIYGFICSSAEEYATAHRMQFVPIGDDWLASH